MKIHIFNLILLLFIAAPVIGQDQATSRSVEGRQRAATAQIIINQIDTSAFPKVTVFALVTNDGIPLKGLSADDFRVREDEINQSPLTVAPKRSPLTAVIALDISGSMKKRMADAQAAAKSFIDMLNPEDKVQVLSFAREVKKLNPNGEHGGAKTAVESTVARGDTALYDALFASVEILKNTSGRKVITLLSDGADDNGAGGQLSRHSVDDVLRLAREVNVPIYTIGVGTEIDETTLRKVALETGGAHLVAPEPQQLKELYAKIGEQLAGQYNIHYTSNLPDDGSEHHVQLKYGDATGTKAYKAPLATKDEGEISAKVDILTPEYAELIKAPKAEWEKLLTGKVRQASTEESEQAVFGFKNDKAASFDTLRLFIKETNQYNIKKLEIFTSRDSLKGPYQSVGTFEFENIRMIKTGGWQEVTFAPVTAKYFTFKITSYNGSWVDIPEDGDKGKGIQLMGRIIP